MMDHKCQEIYKGESIMTRQELMYEIIARDPEAPEDRELMALSYQTLQQYYEMLLD